MDAYDIKSDESNVPASEPAFRAAERWRTIDLPGPRDELFDSRSRRRACLYQRNIERYIGTVSVPVGLAGPLRVNGSAGDREYFVPLATTEAALVASYSRGARLLAAAGGALARVVAHGLSRTPMFAFKDVREATMFIDLLDRIGPQLGSVVADTTAHGQLKQIKATVEGNHVYVDLRFTTGDAAGQNMVTFASEAIVSAILAESPVQPTHWFLEANLSGDKKATSQSLGDVRGKRVIAEATIPAEYIEGHLHTSPERMVEYWYAGAVGGVMSGATGVQGHFANGLAALYLACGQDIACVAESATGITRMSIAENGDLYASVTLPNVVVGTVGGGTALPGAKACLDVLGLAGPGNSTALAEVCAALVLGGELSIIGAFCSGDFANAHRALSRGQTMRGTAS